jgi:DNA-nicking Smr family endonuclease
MMARKTDISDSDRQLFRESVGKVDKVHHDRNVDRPAPAPPRPLQTEKDEKAVMAELTSHEYDPADLETGEELLYLHQGLRPKLLRQLRRGHFSIQDQMDLHGLNVETARKVLQDFISYAQRRDFGCIKIIHGKGLRSRNGGPKLKSMTDHVLRRHGAVMAFASARANEGGTGAVIVLLRKKPVNPSYD